MLLYIKATDKLAVVKNNIIREYYQLAQKWQPAPIVLFNATLFNYKQNIVKHPFVTRYLPYINIPLCYEFAPWDEKNPALANIVSYIVDILPYGFLVSSGLDGLKTNIPNIHNIIENIKDQNYNKLFTNPETIYSDYNNILLNSGKTTLALSNIIHNALDEQQKKNLENNQKINQALQQFLGTRRLYSESLLYGLCEEATSEDMYNIINFSHIMCKSITKKDSIPGIMIGTKKFHNGALYCLNKISSYYNINVSDYYKDNDIKNFLQKCYVNFNFKLMDKFVSRFISVFIKSTQQLEKLMNGFIDEAMNIHYNIGIIHSSQGLDKRDYSSDSDIVNSLLTSTMLNALSLPGSKNNNNAAIFAINNVNVDEAIKSRCVRLQLKPYTSQVMQNIICGYFMQQIISQCLNEYIIFNVNEVLDILYAYLSHIHDIEQVKAYIDLCIYYIISNHGVITMDNIIASIT